MGFRCITLKYAFISMAKNQNSGRTRKTKGKKNPANDRLIRNEASWWDMLKSTEWLKGQCTSLEMTTDFFLSLFNNKVTFLNIKKICLSLIFLCVSSYVFCGRKQDGDGLIWRFCAGWTGGSTLKVGDNTG